MGENVELQPVTRPRVLSAPVQRFQRFLDLVFSPTEKAALAEVLAEFHASRQVPLLLDELQPFLDSVIKRQLLAQLRAVLPLRHRAEFDLELAARGLAPSAQSKLKPAVQPKPQVEPKQRARTLARAVSLSLGRRERPKQAGGIEAALGLWLGGPEEEGPGPGLFVAEVEPDSAAAESGLMPGDRVLAVGGKSAETWSVGRAREALHKASKRGALDLRVVFEGRLPQRTVSQRTFEWRDVLGRPCSPPPAYSGGPEDNARPGEDHRRRRRSGAHHLPESLGPERKVLLDLGHKGKIGVSIRGGLELGLGIFVSGVDPYSPAEQVDLRPGDQLLDVNGTDFTEISMQEASRVLKSSRRMVLTIRTVGKIPFARNIFDRTTWRRVRPSPPPSSSPSSSAASLRLSRGAGSQLTCGTVTLPHRPRPALPRSPTTAPAATTEELLRDAFGDSLSESEFASLCYYVSEYRTGHVTLDSLVLALGQLLASPARCQLLTKVGPAAIRWSDQERFEALVRKMEAPAEARKEERNGALVAAIEALGVSSPEADSGIGAGHSQPSVTSFGRAASPAEETREEVANGSEMTAELDFDSDSSGDAGDAEADAVTVTVPKSAPTLGMAIEGGANTMLPLPRIVSLQPGGSAHSSGELHVGQTILAVADRSLRGSSHRDAARAIAEAFRDPESDSLTLKVSRPRP